jgi:hypothetical protein
MKKAKMAWATVVVVSTFFSANNATAQLAPGSAIYFRGVWDNAHMAGGRGDARGAIAICDVYTSQIWPDPAANRDLSLLLNLKCRQSIVNMVNNRSLLPYLL